ncbi:MAG TPA: glycosyltransferase family 4 protein, partial [Chitinophagaceae bacterium]|nr:glycosyltransferase family 4 protein [Chitinophagaceae bacterium]
ANVYPTAAFKVQHIPMGFDEEYFSQSLKKVDIEYFDNYFSKEHFKNKFIVGYAGTIGLANGVDQIINAAILLQNTNIIFVILGDGPQKQQLIQYVVEKKIDNVKFHDTVGKQEVQAFLQHCDLLLNPWLKNKIIYKYGISPNKWIDYMYSAKPILVTYDGYQSIINEAGCGKFIEPDNPKKLAEGILEFSAMSNQDRELMGKKGKAFLIKNMSYKILAQKYIDLMNNIKL